LADSHIHQGKIIPSKKDNAYQTLIRYGRIVVFCHLALKKLIGEPEINLENFPKYGDIILNYQPKENRLILNLLYYLPTRRGLNIDTIEDKVPLYNIKIRISKELIKRYSMTEIDTIYLPLTNQELEISEEEDFIYFTIPKIDGYEIVVLNLKSEKV